MQLIEAGRQAIRILRSNRLRTALTLFGIVWGTASVVFLVSWGLGVEAMMEATLARVGRNLILVAAGRIGEAYTPAADRRSLWFTLDDVDHLRERLSLATLVVPESYLFKEVAYRQRVTGLSVRGVVSESVRLRGVRLVDGRAITRNDVTHRRRVAVLGSEARKRLLGLQGGVDSRIRIAGQSFEVVGLLQRVGSQLWQDGPSAIDEQVWIPLTTLFTFGPRFGKDAEVADSILISLKDRSLRGAAEHELRSILAERLRVSPSDEEAIFVASPLDALANLPIRKMRGLLFTLGAATLVIGGVGILIMMLESVQERRREIGLRLAVGARRRDIVGQLFLETLVISGMGGLLGFALGLGGCGALAALELPDLIPIPILRWETVAIALGLMTGVCVASGLLPAWRASCVDPSITLRVE